METIAQAEVRVAAQSGEAEFARLFHEYKRRAFQFAFQLTGNPEDAADLTQEAFLRVHRNWKRLDPDRPFAPWLYSIIRNLAIDMIRNRSSRNHREDAVAQLSPVAATPETLARQSEVSQRVWAAIEHLPAKQKEVIVLRDMHGMTYSEIAEVTGDPATAINSRLHDARQALRKQLRRYL